MNQPIHPAYVPAKMPEGKPIQRYQRKPMPRPSVETMPPRAKPTTIQMNVFQGLPQVMNNFDPRGGGGGGQTGGTGTLKIVGCNNNEKVAIEWKDGLLVSNGDFTAKVRDCGSSGS